MGLRFSSQDLELIAKKYVNKDKKFFFQTLSNGVERFEGETMEINLIPGFMVMKLMVEAANIFMTMILCLNFLFLLDLKKLKKKTISLVGLK